MIKPRTLALACIGLCVALFIWLREEKENDVFILDINLPDERPTLFMANVDIQQISSDGTVVMTTKADDLSVYEASNTSLLTNPMVTLQSKSMPTWQITSEAATLKNDETIFEHNVIAIKTNDKTPLVVKSEQLIISESGEVIHSPLKVRLQQGLNTATGIGMNVSNTPDTQTIELLSEVIFNYEQR